ncbi:hypothetical protein Xmau_00283 [Xenorhabdus mauleonii]|uniref:HNH endonuclease n=1 Tax=Xenorhabdus mauleonii TaxID=351675 RepID=A0A1I3XW65_9GAMM|nr:HNH endonuclease [Xenorhabdus mauleonii]PHM45892.1 hypothetical protein Xmau_00283 [Xenorhabdus mauleonii]SFK23733.1 HNH endonuclease [Xenorhabdus mauleonii]
MLTFEEAKRLLNYDPAMGVFTWKVKVNSSVHAGDVAGWDDGSGYIRIKIKGKAYKAHRLAWFMHYGEWPNMNIDHIDRCRSNNEIQNLRLASHYENSVNKGKRTNNKSGIKGVNWEVKNKKWKAQIQADGKKIYLGLFDDIELAEIVVMAARDKLHGEFACHS